MSLSHAPVCIKCKHEMRPTDDGVSVIDKIKENGIITKIWSADQWTCDGCGAMIATGFGDQPKWCLSDPSDPDDLIDDNKVIINHI